MNNEKSIQKSKRVKINYKSSTKQQNNETNSYLDVEHMLHIALPEIFDNEQKCQRRRNHEDIKNTHYKKFNVSLY